MKTKLIERCQLGTHRHQAKHIPKQPQGFVDPELFAAGYNQLSQRSLDQPIHARRDEYPRFPRSSGTTTAA